MRFVSFTKNTTQSFVFHREFYEEKHQVKKKKMTIYSKVSREINLWSRYALILSLWYMIKMFLS